MPINCNFEVNYGSMTLSAGLFIIVFKPINLSLNLSDSSTEDKPDPDLPPPQSRAARSWAWLVDMERACALLIGRCLGGMLVGTPMSTEERSTALWLSKHLFSNGLQSLSTEPGQ